MRTFVEKEKVTQQTRSANSTLSGPILSGQSRDVNPILHLQRMIGNQAVQRLLQTGADDNQEGSNPNASPRRTHDFSRIPLHPTTPTEIQPKLEISTPGDRYEQEADRVADEIMRMPASKAKAAPPRIQRLSRENDHRQSGQTLRARGSSAATEPEPSPATEASVRSLDSGGKPLDAVLRSFFEPRFGHSFEQVRVHTDAAAAASAEDVSALAYTRGRHIVFAPGQFEPHTERGQRLLAHELTHVVQQGWAGQERLQRAYLIPTPDATSIQEVPRLAGAITAEEDETPKIQRQPGPNTPDAAPAPALASPTISFSPGSTIVRGDTITASVGFTPTAGETLKVTDWRYTTRTDTVTRPKTDAKFQSEWKGKMALSGNLELSFTVKPRGKPAVAGTAVTSAVTVNDRTGGAWKTTMTDSAETPLTGAPSPPEFARQLGLHDIVSGYEPAAAETPITSGPNTGFTFVASVGDRNYVSLPHLHPDVANAASAFRVFHRDASRLYLVSGPVRRLIPLNEYTVVSVSGSRMTFNVPDWTKFYQKYGVLTVTVSDGRTTVPAQNGWWELRPNTEAGGVTITNPGAVRAALQIGPKAPFNNPVVVANGQWESRALMPSAKIEAATRSHEFVHATHSHRANFHKIVSALDPRRVLESSVSTPSNPVTFQDKIHGLMTEIKKPDHELVDEAASKTAGRFVPVAGKTMAAVNEDPASGAILGALWDITHDQPLR